METAANENSVNNSLSFQRAYYSDDVTALLAGRRRDFEERTRPWCEEANKRCLHTCRKEECDKHDFAPRLVSSTGYGWVSVYVIGPTETKMTSESTAKIEPISLITQLLSVLSFWFALSPMAMFGIDMYSHLPRIRMNRRKAKSRHRQQNHVAQVTDSNV
jgi:hypothetical protein